MNAGSSQRKRKDPPSPSQTDEEDKVEEERLSWRLDQKEFFSDWKIVILVNNMDHDTYHVTYHVHRAVMVSGSKKSDYFTRLFQGEAFAEQTHRTSCIEMEDEVAAKEFPLMLDYHYGAEVRITHNNCVPLLHLSNYFGNDSLREQVQVFLKNSLALSKSDICLQHAKLLHEDEVYQGILKMFCISREEEIDEADAFLENVDDEIWLDVLKISDGKMSRCLSTKLANFFLKKKDILDTATFLKLTDSTLLPELSHEAAISFMRAEKIYLTEPSSMESLSSLQTRCVSSLVQSLHLISHDRISAYFKEWNPLVVSHIAAGTANISKKREDVVNSSLPKSLVVSGAGTAAVNGAYIRNAVLYERLPRYTKSGSWLGEEVNFVILAVYQENVGIIWYLSILHAEAKMPDGSDKDFYASSLLRRPDACCCFPPRKGWQRKENGQSPVPTVTAIWENTWHW